MFLFFKPNIYIQAILLTFNTMRTKNKSKMIAVTEELHKRLVEDRDHFQETIGGGRWSLSDTITEYLKIIPKRK